MLSLRCDFWCFLLTLFLSLTIHMCISSVNQSNWLYVVSSFLHSITMKVSCFQIRGIIELSGRLLEASMEKTAAIEYLKSSPVFAMSLSSKELFHSNFWAWLMEQDSEFITCFFDDFANTDNERVKIFREKDHMDIQVQIGEKQTKRIYVIENKFKSIPTESQLCKYSETDGFQKGVLTGISKDSPFKLPSKWEYLSYDCICKRLKDQLQKGTENENLSNNKMIVTQYIEMTRNLVGMVEGFLNECGNKWLFPDKIPKEIQDLRIGDVVQKMQAERFLHYFSKHSRHSKKLNPEKFPGNDDHTLIARTGMTTATSFFEVLYMKPEKREVVSKDNKDKEYIRIPKDSEKIEEGIGIQIQKEEFRWFVIAEGNRDFREVFQDERYRNSWFDIKFVAGSGTISTPTNLGKKPTGLGGKGNVYRKFAPNFICQYFTLSEDELEFQKLVELIDLFLDAASKVIRAPGR